MRCRMTHDRNGCRSRGPIEYNWDPEGVQKSNSVSWSNPVYCCSSTCKLSAWNAHSRSNTTSFGSLLVIGARSEGFE